ncbi:MAG: GAF domain-containing protein, partial [Microbacterium sp.]|nr:GAF domain-containing protein [Microbacterium sp.]
MPGSDPLSFPDGPRHDLDRAHADLVERANAVANTQGRLRDLLRATRELIEETDLPLVLRRIVEAAVELVGARYGAMGVVAPDGTLEQFIHVGMPADTAASIGHLPGGAGLLGALIADPTPIRLEHITDDERSVGFPAHHPPMDSFLGVPVRVRDQVFGNLYLTDSGARSFSREDEELVTSLAATAGFAIDNARLLQETRLRARWAAATTELTTQLLDPGTTDPDAAIAVAIAVAADADLVCIVRASADEEPLRIAAAWGATDEPLVGTALAATGTAVADALGTDAP